MKNCYQIIETGLLILDIEHNYMASPYLFYNINNLNNNSIHYVERRYPDLDTPQEACDMHNDECKEMDIILKSMYEVRIHG